MRTPADRARWMRAPVTLTAAALTRVLLACGVTATNARRYAPTLAELAPGYGATTPLRWGHLLAQLLHESARMRYDAEIWGPTAAQRRYEDRRDLGNVRAGDGRRFKGRGLIQLTGRANFAAFTRAMHQKYGARFVHDFELQPELVSETRWAVEAALWFFKKRVPTLWALADAGDGRADVEAVTLAVNGGRNGLEDRVRLFVRAMDALDD